MIHMLGLLYLWNFHFPSLALANIVQVSYWFGPFPTGLGIFCVDAPFSLLWWLAEALFQGKGSYIIHRDYYSSLPNWSILSSFATFSVFDIYYYAICHTHVNSNNVT